MNQQQYFADEAIQAFAKWFADNLETGLFAHRYRPRRAAARAPDWSCKSLYEAYSTYAWPFPTNAAHDFSANAIALDNLRKKLRASLEKMDSASLLAASLEVMRWGGVMAGNGKWLKNNKQALVATFRAVKAALDKNDEGPLEHLPALRFNAGMSKIYSLLCESLVIYDSRVAAALGFAVVKWCLATGKQEVPAFLKFPFAPAKEAPKTANPKRRNASRGGLVLPRMQAGLEHARWNLRASWLLKAVLETAGSRSKFNNAADPMRALEAALFMIGYDLPALDAEAVQGQPIKVRAVGGSHLADEDDWTKITTATGSPFAYDWNANQIRARSVGSRGELSPISGRFPIDRIQALIIAIEGEFHGASFPLANSRDKVPEGLAIRGLGTVVHELVLTKGAKHASRLGPILEDLDIFVRSHDLRGTAWHLAGNVVAAVQARTFSLEEILANEAEA